MITKIFVFILILSILFLLREALMFVRYLISGKENITNKRLWGIAISIAYILTIIFTGF